MIIIIIIIIINIIIIISLSYTTGASEEADSSAEARFREGGRDGAERPANAYITWWYIIVVLCYVLVVL